MPSLRPPRQRSYQQHTVIRPTRQTASTTNDKEEEEERKVESERKSTLPQKILHHPLQTPLRTPPPVLLTRFQAL
ncbi:hypothetical protein NMY22_g20118 [Coprinellus aureogranulatus]|nr:hypothetical protein NMY22_g20118 [Coprinellus aureogranulatus]